MCIFSRFTFSSMALASAALLAGCGSGEGSERRGLASDVATTAATCEPVGLGDAHPEHARYQATLDHYAEKRFSGIVALVFTPKSGLWVGAAGYADQVGKIPMQPCNQFFSGSVAKTYTVTAALSLVERGDLRLDEPIAAYLPEEVRENLPNAKLATVEQLMNHTAGMPDHDEEAGLEA